MNNYVSHFAKTVILAAGVVVTCVSAQLVYEEGKEYIKLKNQLPLIKAGQPQVVEYFSYTCPHCYDLDPRVIKWSAEQKPDNVGFYQFPSMGGKLMDTTARIKMTADKLNLGPEFDGKLFKAIHKDKIRQLMLKEDVIIDFFVKEAGISEEEVKKAWNSLQVRSKMKSMKKRWFYSGITGVPAIVVNGKYLVRTTHDDTMFKVTNFLLSYDKVVPKEESTSETTAEEVKKEEVQTQPSS